jgi:enediyne biosynthesis protein E8
MALTRRQVLWLAAVGSAGVPAAAYAATPTSHSRPRQASSTPLGTTSDPQTMTLEAWADTLIPGRKRYASDYAIAGAARGAGAVQAGAIEFMQFGPTGVSESLPAFVAALSAEATSYAASHRLALDPTLPPFVALRFRDRKTLVASLTGQTSGDQQLLWFAFSGLVFLAYHTAGYLHTAHAVRSGHPGLTAIGFPEPDEDDLWRFPHFSYQRKLARRHPRTTKTGQPA